MSTQENPTSDNVYELAKELATQLPACQGSSFGDVMFYLAVFIFVMCAIAMAFVLVEFWKERYWLKVNRGLPKGAALRIVKRSMVDYKDQDIDALKTRIEKEQAERKVRKEEERIKSAGLQDIAVSRAGLGADTNTTSSIFGAAQEGTGHDTSAQTEPGTELTWVSRRSAEKGPEAASDEENTDHYEMVSAAEEGRALLPHRA